MTRIWAQARRLPVAALLDSALLVAGLLMATAGPSPAASRHRAEPAALHLVATGVVSHVSDGDTVWLKPDGGGRAFSVRILGIDAPERCQAGGERAREVMIQRVQGRAVRLMGSGAHDRYGRELGRVYLGSIDLGEELVRQGWAWSYRYRRDPGPYAAQEAQARADKRGLHAQRGVQRPREFRQRHGPCEHAGHPSGE